MGKMFFWILVCYLVPAIASIFMKNKNGAKFRGVSYILVSVFLIVFMQGKYISNDRWKGEKVDYSTDTTSYSNNSAEIYWTQEVSYPGILGSCERMEIANSSASSSISERHLPVCLYDGDITTSWQEGASGYGYGEYVALATEDAPVAYIVIYNGNQKSESSYWENGRVQSMNLALYYTNGESDARDITIPDTSEPIIIKVENSENLATFGIVITEVYTDGAIYEDTCISEIELYK